MKEDANITGSLKISLVIMHDKTTIVGATRGINGDVDFGTFVAGIMWTIVLINI